MEKVLKSQRSARWSFPARFWLLMVLGLLVSLGNGCNQSTPGGNAQQYYARAKKQCVDGDFKAAAESYRKAVQADPAMAQAHFELAMLYEDKLGDPIAAIYHYRQFLELEPSSSKKQLAEDFIERAKLSLATKLPQAALADPGELARLQAEKGALMKENAALKAQLAALERRTPVTRTVDAAVGTTVTETGQVVTQIVPPLVTTPPLPVTSPATAPRTHMVQKGDTLQSLALRYYGTRSAWEKIYQANSAILPSKDQLRIGQQLVIP